MQNFSMLHWLIVGVVLWLGWRALRPSSSKASIDRTLAASPKGFAKIRGNGKFSVDVVGESFYRQSFLTLLGKKAGEDTEHFCDAVLRLEKNNPHDSLAVSVWIDALQVGHLSREHARELRQAVSSMTGDAVREEYAVAARLYAGGADELFSVSVDLPET